MPAQSNTALLLQSFLAAGLIVFLFFAWEGHTGFNLWDEGYLWYGVQRVMRGEVPLRDFMAYDPGRYYWSAWLMGLWGDDGIVALRATVAMFEALGIFAGLYWIGRSMRRADPVFLLLAAITLAAWMYPRHKLVDISLSIFLVCALTFLVERPAVKRYFLAGLCVGLVAVFGRNHGLYGIVAGIGVICWLGVKRTEGPTILKGLACWVAGIAAGFAPVAVMALLIPGFAIAFWESIAFLFEIKATTIPLPVPWPWLADFTAPIGKVIWDIGIGLLFIGVVVFGVAATLWVCWRRLQSRPVPPALVAASLLALPYIHRVFSRASINTLAQGIYPVLIGCLVILAIQRPAAKWPLTILTCFASLWMVHPAYEGWQCRTGGACVETAVSGDRLRVLPFIASDIALLRQLADEYATDGRNVYVAPFWPGSYPLLERPSPTWEIYALFPRSAVFQQAEIARLAAAEPGFVLIYDVALDGRDDLRFRNTHALIYQYVLEHFERVESANPAYLIFRAKAAGQ